MALLDTLKAAAFCSERGVPVPGVVENMAGMTCPHCDGHIEMFPRDPLTDRLAESGIETLLRLPFSPALAERMVGAFAREQSAAMSGELAESLGVDAQMEGIEAALAAQPGLDEAEVRAEIQALIDGEVDRLVRE